MPILKSFQKTCPLIKPTERATYQGIVKNLSKREFVEDVAIVKDCLAQLFLLSEALQKQQASLIKANRHLKWTLNAGADPGRGESGSSHGQIFSHLGIFCINLFEDIRLNILRYTLYSYNNKNLGSFMSHFF